jgi:hypothetical protein
VQFPGSGERYLRDITLLVINAAHVIKSISLLENPVLIVDEEA